MALTTIGCVGPSPKVENGRYNDYRHNISFVTPESWRQVKEIPQNVMPRRNPRQMGYKRSLGCLSDAVFVNRSGTGVIAIQLNQSVTDASKFPAKEIKKIMEEAQASRKKVLVKAFEISDYRCSVSPECVTENPSCLYREKFKFTTKKEFVVETRLYAFVVNKNCTGALRVMLFSDAGSVEKNRLVLDRLLKTIKRISPEQATPGEFVVKG